MPKAKVIALRDDQATNGGEEAMNFSLPYRAEVTLSGVCPASTQMWSLGPISPSKRAVSNSMTSPTSGVMHLRKDTLTLWRVHRRPCQ